MHINVNQNIKKDPMGQDTRTLSWISACKPRGERWCCALVTGWIKPHLAIERRLFLVKMEQRVSVKFSYKLKNAAVETHEVLVQAYQKEAVSKKCVCEWFKRFRDGKETVEDESRSGRLSTSRTAEMIEQMREMLARDRRLMAEELGIGKETVSTIVRKDLGKQKICSRFDSRAKRETNAMRQRFHQRVTRIALF